MRRSRVLRWVRAAVALGFLAVLAVLLWPVRLGGAATFVVVRGHSMEGTYAQGDLLYARTSTHYRVGDVAVYRVPKGTVGAGVLVVHRIRAILPDGKYLFQGDNKPAPDDVTPSRADLVAKPMLDLGDLPTRALILAPIVFTIIAGVAVTVALWPARTPDLDDADTDVDTDVDIDARGSELDVREAGPVRAPWGPQPEPDAPVAPIEVRDPTEVG